jgi:16S rRNA (adenine1518-N6/adenine1519-N6)-dimethyltransferase
LKDESIAKDIADTLNLEGYDDILEGPGMGVLTKYLLNKPVTTYVIEIDTESVTYLDETYPKLKDKIISQDFLRYNINEMRETVRYHWEFPQYFDTNCFRTLEYRDQIPEFAGMFQKEVAQRL